ncbi:helix-turn-helix domain-containing protein [Verrucomicrobium sp. 3C]|uniref:helix-turn-helix domain-containing protein n=1 Tax=Verrucomicrobium sp. 3C TaxID=1134055 RepID=UPI00039AD6AA|nr:XRE family transcriptional regulator [Verrucomicrobium sp. 3C]
MARQSYGKADFNRSIGARIRALRQQRGLSQEALARLFGFKDRQTVSAIETSLRRLTADELLVAVGRLGAPLDYFTDPFLLAGEARFSWRKTEAEPRELRRYEEKAGRWIAAYRAFAPGVDALTPPRFSRSLRIRRQSRFEEALEAGERFATEFHLGAVPAASLIGVMERELGILVLMVDAPRGISGAACRLPELDALLIHRAEVIGRRHFDLAHELFHLLTWREMPPKYSEATQETGGDRVEQLANRFASALLMPRCVLDRFGPWPQSDPNALADQLNRAADELQVDGLGLEMAPGCSWPDQARAGSPNSRRRLVEQRPGKSKGRTAPALLPALSGGDRTAIADGHLSVRRACQLLDLNVEDLAALFAAHGVASPVDL